MSKNPVRPMLSDPDLSGLPCYLQDRHVLWLSPERGRGVSAWVQGQLTYLQCSTTVVLLDWFGSTATAWGSTPELPEPFEYGLMGHHSSRILPDAYGSGPVPWDREQWIPYKEGVAVFANRNPRAHHENVGWCKTCHQVARTSGEVEHHWRCTDPQPAGCKIDAVLDGPNVLMRAIKVHVDDRGREYLLGAAINGTGAPTISEQTPERFTWNKLRSPRRTPKVTLGHVDFWVPSLPVAWITSKSQPHERRYSSAQEGRYVQVQAVARWNDHANAGSINMEPRAAARWWAERYPRVTFSPNVASTQKEYDAVKSWTKDSVTSALDTFGPPPDAVPVERDGVLKHDLTPYTGNRGPRQIIHQQTADTAERRLEEDRIRKEAAREAARKMLENGAIG